jgi:hypothetical protein
VGGDWLLVIGNQGGVMESAGSCGGDEKKFMLKDLKGA